MDVSWNVPCSLIMKAVRASVAFLKRRVISTIAIALMKKAVSFSGTSVNIHQTT